ncbi:sperm-associated antigen 4 protein isoform X18 [Pipistrellus kuhlii]|uniref:sperm-associated antigen 4 protein isoform X18 n=1 Tax=Pipistrellus kuhlii TaxID=59472 RepID=UPI001E26F3AC|nr:sperm-associated antigen 4 protein isoform X18 [Pipistrellus kuhlii]
MRRGPRPGSAASPHKQAPNFYSDNSNSSVSTTSGDSSGHRSAGPGPGEPEGRRAQGSSCGEPALSPGLPGGAPRSHSAPTAEGAATLRGGASEPAGSPVVSEEQFHLLAALDLRQEMQPPRVFKSFLSPLFQVLSVCVSPLGDVLVSVYREVCSIRFLLTAVSLLSLFLTALGWGVLYLVPPLESGANHPVPTSRLQRVPRARAHAGAAAAAAAGRAGQAPPGGVQRPRSQQRGASIDLEKTSRDYEDQNGAYFWNRFSFWNYARPPMVILEGLQVDDETEVFLGKFTFDMEKSEIQTFRLQNDPPTAFPKVKIQILSNWGHPHFTCLYRVRAHGMRTSEEAGDSATGGPN